MDGSGPGDSRGASHLSAREAAARLGVSLPTLYAYVSRGIVRSEAAAGGSRSRSYNLEDIELLRERKELRRNPARATREALHWGAPLLESGLTLISEGRLYYRGYDAEKLAIGSSLEEVAGLLWLGEPAAGRKLFERSARSPLVPRTLARLERVAGATTPIQRLSLALVLAGGEDLAAYDPSPEGTAGCGARIARLAAAAVGGSNDPALPVNRLIATGWGLSSRTPSARTPSETPTVALPEGEAARLLDAALILCADHELNASTFAARVVASAGSQPYLVASAGLAALQGAHHGGATEAAEALIREALAADEEGSGQGPERRPRGGAARGEPSWGGGGSPRATQQQRVERLIAERLRRGEAIPGFGHRLYPKGDPRATLLLSLARAARPGSPLLDGAELILAAMRESVGLAPNLDFALGLLSLLLALPRGSAIALLAVGRTVGWIAHAIEQNREGRIIRPRASYSGPPPR